MSKDEQQLERNKTGPVKANGERRVYIAPAIEEEALIENLAMSCAATKNCAPQST